MGHSARILAHIAAALCVGVGGCATCPAGIRTALNQPVPAQSTQAVQTYTLACPDHFALQVLARPDLTREYVVEPDGCVGLANVARLRVDGATTSEVEATVCNLLRLPQGTAHVQVTAFASRSVLLLGPTRGAQRVVPYHGSETVVDLLRRTGGFDSDAAFDSVNVVRPHVAEGRRPEVFPVDLQAILVGRDSRSNVLLEPNDQVYLGETRSASVTRSLPPWMRAILPGTSSVDSKPVPGKNN